MEAISPPVDQCVIEFYRRILNSCEENFDNLFDEEIEDDDLLTLKVGSLCFICWLVEF